jgi:hypothetical protein
MTETGVLDAKSLNELVAAGLIVPDDTLKEFFRTRYDLPVPDPKPEPPDPPIVVAAPPQADVRPTESLQRPPQKPEPPIGETGSAKPVAGTGFSEHIADYAQWLDARRAVLAAEAAAVA